MNKEQKILFERMNWLIVLRVVLVTALLGLPLLLQLNYLKNSWSFVTFYFLIGSTYFLTILYAIFLKKIEHRLIFAAMQLSLDLLFETALIAVTGGIESPFSFLYILTIVSASIFFYRKGGLLMASGATLCFGTLIHLQYAEYLPFKSGIGLENKEIFYMLFLYMIAFFTVGTLSGRLSERLHEKEVGFSDLRIFHEDIVQSMSSGLITTDLEGKVTSFNRSAAEITGFRPDEVIGAIWWEFFSWEEIRSRYHDLAQAGTAQRFEGEIINKKGNQCLLGVTISPLRNEQGSQVGIIGTFQDLTQIRNLEEEMQKKERLATVGEMAAGMAHEIRNPLASLSGSIEVLKSELRLDDENRKLMEIAVTEAARLNSIITQFLLYARPAPPRLRRANLYTLISDTVKLIKNSPEYDTRINVVLPNSSDPLLIMIDPDQIKQVFWNLSINAFQAMPTGGTLTISTRLLSSKPDRSDAGFRKGNSPSSPLKEGESTLAADQVEIIFKDTGNGIRKEDLPKIFYPFFTTKNSGSGLGLSIVQRVIEEHGGKIEVQSSPEGTGFFMRFPLEEGMAPLNSKGSNKTENLSETGKRDSFYSAVIK
jgi:two-component system sensor histidine kinase PilS (NtrC family)